MQHLATGSLHLDQFPPDPSPSGPSEYALILYPHPIIFFVSS